MKKTWKLFLLPLLLAAAPAGTQARQWTLQQCISYALEHNITLQKNRLSKLSAYEDVKQSQAALLPSLSASTSHNVTYNPWPETGSYTIQGSKVESSVDKVYYNGSYGINANWTVWNGNRNRNQLKVSKLTEQQAELDSATTALSIQEQIANLYVQILYSTEAIKVNKQSLETSRSNEKRGQEMVEVGKMSKADLSQLTAQRAQDEYNVVAAETALSDYKRQLKKLLQITDEDAFDVVIPTTTDDMALQAIPALHDVYTAALETRPEIQNALLGIKTQDLNIKLAKAQRLPTIGLNANASTATASLNDHAWGTQLKNNFGLGGGLTVSIPLFDQRQTKTAVNKAILQKQSYQLDLQNQQTTLFSTIENYWLQATSNQSKFRAAKTSAESAQASYDLLSEQFKLGLKNIVELMNGKDQLLQAQQNELQSKYLAILNIDMLRFYESGQLK